MGKIELKIMIKPQSKQSTRFGRGHSYTCAKKRRYCKDLIRQVEDQCKKISFPKGKKLSMSVEFAFMWRKTDKKDTWLDVTPDLTNIIKPLEDSMNGIVYADDSQIVKYGDIIKTRRKEGNYIMITLEEVPDNPPPGRTIK